MKKIIINGRNQLAGQIGITGSKNSIVALIPAAILARDRVRLYNYPEISDVDVLLDILKELNVKADKTPEYLEIDSSNIINTPLITQKMTLLRASYYFMGALLALYNEAQITLPGGCYLGPRPIDIHLKGFEALGCKYSLDEHTLYLHADKIRGTEIDLAFPSVGATINIMLASIFIYGKTVITNAAKEPEIVDLANFLNKMGADITGAGTERITVTGVKTLRGTTHRVIPDRIEAGTYLIMGGAVGGEIEITNCDPVHLQALIKILNQCGVNTHVGSDRIIIEKAKNIHSVDVTTAVYPGFPTDLQQILTAFLTQASGVSTVRETIYTDRFKNCQDLIKMGAKITISGQTAVITGPAPLTGTIVKAPDLRGGASLVLAGLIAEGETTILEAEHILRGYGKIIEKLQKVNANLYMSE